MRSLNLLRMGLGTLVLACALPLAAAPLDDMVAFDATYIPALAQSSSAAQSAAAVPKARATLAELKGAWPTLRARLDATWGRADAGWSAALARVDGQLAQAQALAVKEDWKEVHEALEPVRIELMKARAERGLDYFVDLLTAFHEPMEVLALAGGNWRPEEVDARRRAELQTAFGEARAKWQRVLQYRLDAAAYGLSADKLARVRSTLAEETVALERLDVALRGTDNAALLKAAAAVKPPYARAFTAFGRSAEDPR